MWVGLLLLALAGFLGGGAASMWRTDHRGASVLLGVLAAGCLAGSLLWLIPW
jgi:hypothetical protein